MITADQPVFPNVAIDVIAYRAKLLDPAGDLAVHKRPLLDTDEVQAIGIFGALWTPTQESLEMRGSARPGPQEPTLSRYSIAIQGFVKDMDQERGAAAHSVLSKLILAMLYRDEPLRVGLAGLSATVLGSTETLLRWGVTTQRFLNNELDAEWLYLSTVECWLETETY